MKAKNFTRRKFVGTVSASTLGAVAIGSIPAFGATKTSNKLAILGGNPVRQNKSWPDWPYVDKNVMDSIEKTTQSGIWCRIQDRENGTVVKFERQYAEMMGVTRCVAVGSGTQALHTAVEALGLGPGDEVITSPYTDPGTIAAILSARALPVLADIDRYSFQVDPDDVERRITKNTKAIMPVHMMGQPADLDRFLQIARKYNLFLIEDACQAHFAKFRGKMLGSVGDIGCFSHQSSKVISCGEGGSIISNNAELMEQCYTVQNHGTSKFGRTETIGPKYRMNEFEGAILLGQLPTAMERHAVRNKNAQYLTSKIKDIPGITPQKLYDGTEEGSFYLYTMNYNKEEYNGVPREKYLKALAAEGVGLSPYIKNGLHREPWVDNIMGRKEYQQMYGKSRLEEFKQDMACPVCDLVCDEEMVMLWASGPLLGTTDDMDDVINALAKVYENRDQLKSI
ncbi:DegT/DnrJ/EryC1/StrS family aminotransferase [Mariniphaga sediminis]|uniref:DegT/DnrJ/EryC1/StrS family aminotransferase n=1 Tax=Mariniphaga sediminis TaxID=1628158 RepID=A0A399CZ40_9BACT|nr:DegT/DnrJ/EryC1/StrS family aminotransferase [Mariniphaga sediminis]RIH63752.1 DegT/DnrJ/EryC1/StrS family aminotransferase [Mariniphaga sediminis]